MIQATALSVKTCAYLTNYSVKDKTRGVLSNLSPISRHLHRLQVENGDSNSRLVENENVKFRLHRVKDR